MRPSPQALSMGGFMPSATCYGEAAAGGGDGAGETGWACAGDEDIGIGAAGVCRVTTGSVESQDPLTKPV